MRFGFALPHYGYSIPGRGGPDSLLPWEEVLEWAKWAEEGGFDSIWVSDHLALDLSKYGGSRAAYPSYDLSTLLGALAHEISEPELGTLVACVALRHPTHLASLAASVATLTQRRFWLGMGAGWYGPDFEAVGQSMPPAYRRFSALEAAVREVRRLLGSSQFPVTVEECREGPQPERRSDGEGREGRPAVRTFVGGKGGPRVLRAAAAAGGWNVSWEIPPEELAQRVTALKRLHEMLSADERSTSTGSPWVSVGLTCLVGENEAELRRSFEAMLAAFALSPPGGIEDAFGKARRSRLVVTPEELPSKLQSYQRAGADELICCFGPVPFSVWSRDSALAFVQYMGRYRSCD